MTTFEETGPRAPVVTSTRVDKIRPVARFTRTMRALIVIALALVGLIPGFGDGHHGFQVPQCGRVCSAQHDPGA